MSDYGLTSFTESGELTQVRNALTAVGRGETVVGIRARNGIVIAAEKKLPTILKLQISLFFLNFNDQNVVVHSFHRSALVEHQLAT